ncbi:MAG: type I secretion system permease/ATPase [Telmatospirillum sp.]|nr:type I secretion system permease/ATPase [Telmatospirillum sp.]
MCVDDGRSSGAAALALSLQFLGIAVDETAIHHEQGGAGFLTAELLVRAARQFPVKARIVRSSVDRIRNILPPAIMELKSGGFLVLGRVGGDRVVVQDPLNSRPVIMRLEDLDAIWSGRMVLVARRIRLGDLKSARFGLGWFASAIYKYRLIFCEVLISSLFLQIFALISPLFFQVVIDKVLVHRGLSTLEVLAVGLGILSIFDVVLGGLRTYIFSHTANRIDVELGARLFRHLFSLPISYFESRRVGDSVARVRELENIRQFLTGSTITFILDVIFSILFLCVMFIYSPVLTFVVVVTFPIIVTVSVIVTPILRDRLNERFRRGAENQSLLVESVTGVETIKAMAIEPELQRHWEEQLSCYVDLSFQTQILGTIAIQTITLVNKLSAVAILFVGARLVMANDMTVGELVAFNMLASQTTSPILRLANLWQDFQQVRLSMDRLGDILNTQPEPSLRSSRSGLPPLRGDIRLDNVTFRFRPDLPQALSAISLSIPSGQILGIVGPSGSGKSTLVKLIQRFYVPESGRVFVDGTDLATIDPTWLRRRIGVVLQENVLFNRSVRENIALVDPSIPSDRIIHAATLAGAHEFITRLPQGYDTIIGERGTSLSGGQKQRIAIARALVSNPRILILDEATSALDCESEQIIQANMRAISEGRTVLIIAHRLSTVRSADRIITVEQGRIVEDGTHEELIRTGGRYAALYRIQAGLNEAG